MVDEVPSLPDARPAERRRDRVIGLLIVAVAFAAALGLSYWAKIASRPETSAPPGPPTTDGVIGYPSAVDPVKTLPLARAATKRVLLRGFVAEGVRSDGTVDLGEGPGRVRYAFQSPQGHGPQPPREPGTLPRRHYCGKQNVHLRREGLVADPDVPEYPCPAPNTDHLPDPRCGLREVWAHALARGAMKDRLARIEYYRSRGGPAWRFELPGTPYRFSLYGDCAQELQASDAYGSVP
jgi:hypothetical protein